MKFTMHFQLVLDVLVFLYKL
uniref:Uncharacterized protein n=1 Tax=Arundo donax TaxID=35708 RepID=A0A0A8Y926_ARUDO